MAVPSVQGTSVCGKTEKAEEEEEEEEEAEDGGEEMKEKTKKLQGVSRKRSYRVQ